MYVSPFSKGVHFISQSIPEQLTPSPINCIESFVFDEVVLASPDGLERKRPPPQVLQQATFGPQYRYVQPKISGITIA